MKRKNIIFIVAAVLVFAAVSCDRLGEEGLSSNGRLNIAFVKGGELLTRAYLNLPDTSDFLLTVSDGSGTVLYDGKYGACPESMEVPPGSYNIRIVSSVFSKPAFDAPQFGDEQCVTVPSGGVTQVRLVCSQMNAGVNLDISPSFLEQCPESVLFLKSSQGKLMYSYSEMRTAYFLPGAISLVMSTGGTDQVLMVRNLQARDMLSIGVSVPLADKGTGGGMSVSIDTSRVWVSEDCIIGQEAAGSDVADALGVAQARESAGMTGVWVSGFVVGGDLTSAAASFDGPFKSRTNILLGPRSTTTERDACISVQLPSGDVRDALNLVDNPDLLGRRVCVRGDVVSAYYGLPGMKNINNYQLF